MPPIEVPCSFRRELQAKPKELVAAIIECIKRLEEDPRHPSLRTHKVRGHPTAIEAYVDKANRVTFEWDGPVIRLRAHCNHDIIKRRP